LLKPRGPQQTKLSFGSQPADSGAQQPATLHKPSVPAQPDKRPSANEVNIWNQFANRSKTTDGHTSISNANRPRESSTVTRKRHVVSIPAPTTQIKLSSRSFSSGGCSSAGGLSAVNRKRSHGTAENNSLADPFSQGRSRARFNPGLNAPAGSTGVSTSGGLRARMLRQHERTIAHSAAKIEQPAPAEPSAHALPDSGVPDRSVVGASSNCFNRFAYQKRKS
jgi:hypothetical protein